MNRSELLEIVATKSDSSKATAARVLDALIDTIQTTVANGDSVSLVGFGTFKSAQRQARVGVNPKTGESLEIAAAIVPKFTAGATFKTLVDPKAAAGKAKAEAK